MDARSPLQPILLIDDNDEDLFFTRRLLARAGLSRSIVTMDNGEDGIAFLTASIGKPDMFPAMVICDLRMPTVDGFAVLGWAKTKGLLSSLTFVVLTGGDMPEDRERAIALGAHHFLTKYPSIEVIKRVLKPVAQHPPVGVS